MEDKREPRGAEAVLHDVKQIAFLLRKTSTREAADRADGVVSALEDYASQRELVGELGEALHRTHKFLFRCESNGGSTEGQNTTLREECAALCTLLSKLEAHEGKEGGRG